MNIDALHKISVSGGSDRYIAGTYKVADGTLKSPVMALTVESDAVVSKLVEKRFSKTLNKTAGVAYTPNFLNDTLTEGSEYLFEFEILEITIDSGVLILHHVPTGRNTDFTTTPSPTTTPAPTTTAATTTA